jgi:hypothetical protein
MRSTGELLYLLMVIGAFTIFTIVLAWVERTWQPKRTAQQPRALNAHAPHAAE